MKERSLVVRTLSCGRVLLQQAFKIVSVDVFKGVIYQSPWQAVPDQKLLKGEWVYFASQFEFEQQEYEDVGCLSSLSSEAEREMKHSLFPFDLVQLLEWNLPHLVGEGTLSSLLGLS